MKYNLSILFVFVNLLCFGQKKSNVKKQPIRQQQHNNLDSASIIKTNSKDTLYYEIDNAIVLFEKNKGLDYVLSASNGDVTKLAKNFYTVGNLKTPTVVLTVTDSKTKKKLEERKFYCTKQVLPF